MIYSSIDRVIIYYIEDNVGYSNIRTTTGTPTKPSYVDNITITQWNKYSVTLLAGKYRIAKCYNSSLQTNWEEVTYSTSTTISTTGNHSFIMVCKI